MQAIHLIFVHNFLSQTILKFVSISILASISEKSVSLLFLFLPRHCRKFEVDNFIILALKEKEKKTHTFRGLHACV